MGPIISWPNPNPSKQEVKLNCIKEAFVLNSFVMVGNDGKYMSMVNGPSAASDPSNKANLKRLLMITLFNV